MKRIMIIGCSGAGKSTLSRQLHQILGLPLIHLDQGYWNSGWLETPTDIWEQRVKEYVAQDSWIMDGNFRSSFDIRIPRADTIVFLDRSRWVCIWRATKRILKYYGRVRPDMVEGCPERFDWEFFHYIFTYPQTQGGPILERLAGLQKTHQIVHLQSDKAVRQWLQAIQPPINLSQDQSIEKHEL